MLEERSFDCCFSFNVLGLTMKGDVSMSQTIPQRASRPTVEVEDQYDDKLNNTPRSALHFRPAQTDDVPQPVSNRITGNTRALLYLLLALCILFLVSGFNSPMLSGNVIVVHIPLVWIVGIVGVSIVVWALIKK